MLDFPEGRIAVVGNGPNEIGRGKGDEIDSFPTVIRFNNYVTEGFEKDYGSKTTHWASCYYAIVNERDLLPYQCIYCTIPAFNEHFVRHISPLEEHPYPMWSQLCYDMHNHDVRIIPYGVFNSIGHCSSGISLLHWIYAERGNIDEVSIYGFTFFDKTQDMHYFDTDTRHFGDHEHDREKALYQAMRDGRL